MERSYDSVLATPSQKCRDKPQEAVGEQSNEQRQGIGKPSLVSWLKCNMSLEKTHRLKVFEQQKHMRNTKYVPCCKELKLGKNINSMAILQ